MVDEKGENELRLIQLEEMSDKASLLFSTCGRFPARVRSAQISAVTRTLDRKLPLCAAAFGADEIAPSSGTGAFSFDFISRPACCHARNYNSLRARRGLKGGDDFLCGGEAARRVVYEAARENVLECRRRIGT